MLTAPLGGRAAITTGTTGAAGLALLPLLALLLALLAAGLAYSLSHAAHGFLHGLFVTHVGEAAAGVTLFTEARFLATATVGGAFTLAAAAGATLGVEGGIGIAAFTRAGTTGAGGFLGLAALAGELPGGELAAGILRLAASRLAGGSAGGAALATAGLR